MLAAAKDLDRKDTDDDRNDCRQAGYAADRADFDYRGYNQERPETPLPDFIAYVMYCQASDESASEWIP